MSVAMAWGFHNPVRVRFGRGCRRSLPSELEGRACLFVTSPRGRRQLEADEALSPLLKGGKHLWVDGVTANPGMAELQSDIDRLRPAAFDAIVAFGGGSSIDSAKALAVALSRDVEAMPLRTLLANQARFQQARPRPLYAVPTTAGTGSEATPYATVWDHERKRKHSLAGPMVYPRAAYVDPALTDGVPAEVAVSTGLDAMNQAAESIWNRNATPISLALATRALLLGFAALPPLAQGRGGDAERDQMAECSLLAGMAISQSRTALCHSMSYPITAHFGVPHGLACAFTMPAVLRYNLAADDGRLARLGEALNSGDGSPEALLARFAGLNADLGVGIKVRSRVKDLESLKALSGEMLTPGRADNNLRDADQAAVGALLSEAWEC